MTSSLFLSVFLLAGFQLTAEMSNSIGGDYVEVRSNQVYTCGCMFSGEAVTGGTEAILAWNIHTGVLAGVPLRNFKVVAVTVGAENLGMGETDRRTVLYFDGVSSKDQETAGLSLLRERYSDVLGEIIGVREAPIHFQKENDTTSVQVTDIARLVVRKTRLEEDAHPGSSLWYDPFINLKRSTLGTVLHDEYRGEDFSRRWRRSWPAIRSYTGEFALSSDGKMGRDP